MGLRSGHRLRASSAAVALMCAISRPAMSQRPAVPDSVRVARLASLGRLWGAVKYFHPALVRRPIDWDSALVATIPRVRAAVTGEEFADAVDSMLSVLDDRATRVVRRASQPQLAGQPMPGARWEADSTLVVTIGDPTDYTGVMRMLQQAQGDIGRSRRLVIDLRGRGAEADEGTLDYIFRLAGTNDLLVPERMTAPARRSRMYSGFPTQSGGTSGGYWSGFAIAAGEAFEPNPAMGGAAAARRIAFIVDASSDVPPVALALQRRPDGMTSIVAEGAIGDIGGGGSVVTMHLADSVTASVRVAELVDETGAEAFQPDTVVGRGDDGDTALRAALAIVRAPSRARAPTTAGRPFIPAAERAYAGMHFPPLEYRLLAAFRFWTAIQYFYPYRQLMGEDWNAVLTQTIPRFESARDSLEYALAVASLVSRIHDSHGFVGSAALQAYFGQVPPPVRVRYIERKLVVTQVSADSAARARGVHVGDVVVRVDGQPVEARRARIAPYIAHSTPQALDAMVASRILNGPEGSTATLVVRGADGVDREVRLPRLASLARAMGSSRTGPVWTVLPGNVGYVDLERLTVPQVDTMFEALGRTKAIVFDMRGYPQGTAWSIAPRLTDRDAVPAARFQRPMVLSPDTTLWDTHAFVQTLPSTTKPRYHGRTVMLVDERTISQAEHTGLFFEAANGTTFVGSPTMGANGDVTAVMLPGGITAYFTGHDVRHADGRQLQRLGLQPQVIVRPTVAGIRAGRDEVLERALALIR